MIMKLLLTTLLILNLMAAVALGFVMYCRIYTWRHRNDVPTKDEWKIL